MELKLNLLIVFFFSILKSMALEMENLMGICQNYQDNFPQVGFGFDPMTGSLICISDDCVLQGIKQPIFDIQRSQNCNNVVNSLDQTQVKVESLQNYIDERTIAIEKVNEIKNIYNSEIILTSGYGYNNALSLLNSEDVIKTLDNHSNQLEIQYLSYIQVYQWKLSLINSGQTAQNLDKRFKMHVKWLPWENYQDPNTSKIYRQFLDLFGIYYIDEECLGGRIQQLSRMKVKSQQTLEQNNLAMNVAREAAVNFKLSIGKPLNAAANQKQDKNLQNLFKTESKFSPIKVRGGNESIQTNYLAWNQTIMENPLVLSTALKPIAELFNKTYFPDDENIAIKLEFLKKTITQQGLELAKPRDYSRLTVTTDCFSNGVCNCKNLWQGPFCNYISNPPQVKYVCSGQYWSQNYVLSGTPSPSTQAGFETLNIVLDGNTRGLSISYAVKNKDGWSTLKGQGDRAGSISAAPTQLNYIKAIKINLTGQYTSLFRLSYQTDCQKINLVIQKRIALNGEILTIQDCLINTKMDFLIINLQPIEPQQYQ